MATDQLFHLMFKLTEGFVWPPDSDSRKRKPKEVDLVGRCHLTFILVEFDLKVQPSRLPIFP